MTAGAPVPPPRYFAMYLDLVVFTDSEQSTANPDLWTQRWQWIVMPRLPARVSYVVFHRHQHGREHRAVWKSDTYVGPDRLLTSYESMSTQLSHRFIVKEHPPIVVELSAFEVDESIGGSRRKTPWPVLNRATRVAKRLHGFTI